MSKAAHRKNKPPPDRIGDPATRRCIVSGDLESRGKLLRFVAGPDDVVVPDIAEKLPGRGLWVRSERAAIERAVTENRFSRAARRTLVTPKDLVDQVELLLSRRVLDLLGLSRGAGIMVLGFEKLTEAIRKGEIAVLIAAHDASEQGRHKIIALARGVTSENGMDTPVISLFSRQELSLALGRENVVHAGLRRNALVKNIMAQSMKLVGFRN